METKYNSLQKELNSLKSSGLKMEGQSPNNRIIEKTVERIVSGLSQSDLDSGLSNLKTELNNLNTNLTNQINTLSASANRQTAAVYNAVSLTNKIDSLSGTRLTNITVSGVTGLTDSDIPDTITASNYLLLTGGTITGSTTISGQTNLSNATTSLLTVSDGAWFTSGNVGIGTSSPYAKLSVVGPVVAEYFHTTSSTATSTFSGRLAIDFAPTLAHNFGSWSVGASGANPLGASLIINPSSAVADSNLLSLSVNNSAKFLVDAEGDVFANAITVVGGTTLSTTTASTFTVEGNTYLGDATTTDITYFNSRIADSLIPTADNLLDLGDSANWLRWRTGYFGTSVGIGGTATSTGTQLTANGAYLIDSNNTLSINTTNNKAVSFGTGNVVLPYASTTALTVSGSAYIGSLNGPLQANNGLVSATTSVGSIYGGTGLNSSALTGLAQIVSGTWSASSTLSTAFGGTGWNSIQANSILLGNGAGRIATTTAGTDGYVLALSAGVPTWLATSTLSTITGTLTVAKGGTGQTSFGQGWLHSDGTTLTSSTSPTVNYITATSTTATSTFAWGLQANALNITSTAATSTFAQGIDLAKGCFAINGTCVGGGQWTTTGSNIYYTTGNVGIGTTSPWSLLSLKGSSGAQMTIAQADTNYTQLTVDASGNLTITPSGSTITIPDDNLKICAGDACQTTALNSGNGNLTVENNIEIGGNYNRTCATGYVWVPGSAKFGTLPGFCVMKYEAKNDGAGNAVSTATGGPYVSIDQPTSRTKCEAIGLGYHLISEPEWMTIAENIAQTPINDMDDDAGLQLATGHSDNAPASALAATSASDPVVSGCNLSATMENVANAYSAASCEIRGDGIYNADDNDKGFYGTSQSWATTGYVSGGANKSQLRTHILSNGNVVWDIAGDVWEWADAYVNGVAEKPTAVTDTWQEWTAVTNYLGLNYARPQNPSWSSSNGIGKYYAGTVAGQRGFVRGGDWGSGAVVGGFALNLGSAPSGTGASVGFRCVR